MQLLFSRSDRIAVASGSRGVPRPLDLDNEKELEEAIELHKEGKIRIGSYTPTPGESKTVYLCFDLDGEDHDDTVALSDIETSAAQLVSAVKDDGPCYVEVSGSGNGVHVWVLFEPSPANAVRNYAHKALDSVKEGDKIEVFPKQSSLPEDGTGNMVWLPYWGGADEDCCKMFDPQTGEYVAPGKLERRPALSPIDTMVDIDLGIDEGSEVAEDSLAAQLEQANVEWDPPPFEQLPEILEHIPNEGSWERDYNEWFRVLAAIYHTYGSKAQELAYEWSVQSDKHEDSKFEKSWKSIAGREPGDHTVGPGTLIYLAQKHGYVQEKREPANGPQIKSGSHVELAEYLAHEIGEEDLVFDRGRYWHYDKGAWSKVSMDEMKRKIMDLDGRRFGVGTDEDGELKVVSVDLSSNAVSGIQRLIKSLVSEPGFFDEFENGVAFENGFLTLDGLEDHDRDHRCRNRVEKRFDPHATAPVWTNQIIGRLQPDQRRYLQEKVGACLFGLATRYQKATILLGPGEDGKSPVLEVVEALFEEDSVTSIPPQKWENEYDSADLSEAMVNLVAELPDAEILSAENVKGIITGDRTRGRVIRQDPFDYRPMAGHIFAGNQLPNSRDLTHGFWRRWMIVKFPGKIPKEEQVKGIAEQVVSNELVGVYAWAWEGAKRLVEQGDYTKPEGHESEMRYWERKSDSVRAWLYDCTTEIDDGGVPIDTCYQKYAFWCGGAGRHRLSRVRFERRIQDLVGVRDDGKLKLKIKDTA